MKKFVIVVMLLLVSVISAHAQMDSAMRCPHEAQAGQGMSMETCQHQPMMQHMTKCNSMMQEIVGMIKDSLKMQQKMVEGVKSAEKKEMMKELSRMTDRIDVIMADMQGMMKAGMKCETPCAACPHKEPKNEAPATEGTPQPESHKQ